VLIFASSSSYLYHPHPHHHHHSTALPDRDDPIPPSKIQEVDPITSITGLVMKQTKGEDDPLGIPAAGGVKPVISAYGLPHVIKVKRGG
jgi:hypothetical protein